MRARLVLLTLGLIAVTPARWRAVRRWLAWQPGTGLVRPGGLAVARLADLVRVAGVTDPAAVAAVADVVHDPRGDARTVLGDLMTALGLPGGTLLAGTEHPTDLPQGREVEPSAAVASRFESMVHEDTSWRDEMEGRRGASGSWSSTTAAATSTRCCVPSSGSGPTSS